MSGSRPTDGKAGTDLVAAAPDPGNPIVETPPNARAAAPDQSQLELRIRQQEVLAELGVTALRRCPLPELLDSTARLAAEGLRSDLCKILEYLPHEKRLLLRAGVGWGPGLIGVASVGADLESPAGFAVRTGKPVISNHLDIEERFRTPELLKTHGVRRAINVILQGEGLPFGVLEVDSRSEGEFSEHDIAFLQGAANIIGMAIERQHYERSLREALEHQQVLAGEINHRVKNSLQLVGSMFSLQASASGDPRLAQSLSEALGRVTAVARLHERLYQTSMVRTVNLTGYLADVCADLTSMIPHCEVRFEAGASVVMTTDRAIHVALLATELITNAGKHGSAGGPGGELIQVRLDRAAADGLGAILLSVRDQGAGLPDGFDLEGGGNLGMRMIRALAKQMGASISARRVAPGTEFVVSIPDTPEAR